MAKKYPKKTTMFYVMEIYHGCIAYHPLELYHHLQWAPDSPLPVSHFMLVSRGNQTSNTVKMSKLMHLILKKNQGRAYHEGSLTVGKVQISHGLLYIPFDGREVAIDSAIEVLVEH